MMKSCLRILGVALAFCAAARGQFTSQWSTIYLPGTFNGYDTFNSEMLLISNGVWQGFFKVTNSSGTAFLFSNYQFSNPPTNNANTWKETNQSQFSVPMSGVAEFNSGNDISITGTVSGVFRVRFDEVSGAYSVARVNFGSASTNPWINELHYDNASTDTNEGVEIAGPAGLALTNLSLVFYSGNTLRTYQTNLLSGALTNDSREGMAVKHFLISGINNAADAPAGVALVRNGSNVVQFLSYEGLFVPTNGPAAGMLPVDLEVSEGETTPVNYSLQLVGEGGAFSNFAWAGATPHSRDAFSAGQLLLTGPAAATVSVSAVTATPATAQTNQSVKVSATVTPAAGASNVSATLFWRVGGAGNFLPVRMTNAGTVWTTVSNIPPQPNGSVVRFYVFVNFDGPGMKSPVLEPDDAPTSYYSISFSTFTAGSVWINEIDAVSGLDFNAWEFVELAGVAGNNLSGWKVELVDSADSTYATYTLPTTATIPAQTNGFGFFTLGTASLSPPPGVAFTNLAGSEGLMRDQGGVRLFDLNGAQVHAVSYGVVMSGFTYAGEDPNYVDLFADEGSVALVGTGSNLANFTWGTNTLRTYGGANTGQNLVNGYTNPIPPFILCPPDVRLGCANSVLPTNNPNSVSSTGYCGNGAVTVTWVSDSTNSGTGCKGNARIITRTYRAVSQCGSTSTCSQLFILEDTNAPVIIAPTQTLANAGFENGSLLGWQTFGPRTNHVVSPLDPRAGSFHAVLVPPYDLFCRDIAPAENNGTYVNGVQRMQPAATTNLGFSVTFDGTNDYVSLPPTFLNTANKTITCWIKRNGSQVSYAGLYFSRAGTTLSGLGFTTNNQLGYTWNGAAETFNWGSGIVPPNGQWAFVALSVASNRADLYMKVAGSNWVTAANVTNHAADAWDGEIRLGQDNTGSRYYKGEMDDVQTYQRALTSNDIMGIWNNGLGGGETNGLISRFPLDDIFPGPSQSGVFQDLPAASNQYWIGSIWAKTANGTILLGTNSVQLSLQFLNATNGVLLQSNAPVTIGTAAVTNYTRLVTRATAPANTAKARLLVTYHQDAGGNVGQVNIDDAVLSSTVHTMGPCGTLANFRTNSAVSITDACSGTNITYIQNPAAGSAITNGTVPVTITALDPCGNATSATFTVIVDDTTVPTLLAVNPSAITVSCTTNTIATTLSLIDNCTNGALIYLLSSTTNNGIGCPGNPIIITNIYRGIDLGGNFKDAVQIVTVSDTNRPSVILSLPALTNAGFETGTFTNWTTYGNATIQTDLPRTGIRHAKLTGQTNLPANYNGIYQDLATPAQAFWSLNAWIASPTNEPLTGENFLEAKIEYFDENFINIQTDIAPLITNGILTPGQYRQISVSSYAPLGATRIRATLNYVQTNNASGTILLDDIALSRTTLPSEIGCQAFLPSFATLVTPYDCNFVSITQNPPAGVYATNGNQTIRLYSVDLCGNTATSAFTLSVIDLDPPVITSQFTNITVTTTNDIPAPNTNLVNGLDTCTTNLNRLVLPDTTNSLSPLIITRTYRLTDIWGNSAQTSHTITVTGGGTPPAPTNVLVTAHVLGPNALTNTIRATGTNTWSVHPEYSTSLLFQTWLAASNITTIWTNGTNIITYTIPTSAHPAFIRIKQTYP